MTTHQIDLSHYQWKERVQTEDGLRYLTIHRDEMLYEFPEDRLFATKEEAIAWLDEYQEENPPTCVLTSENLHTDDDCTMHEHEGETDTWVLIKYTGVIQAWWSNRG